MVSIHGVSTTRLEISDKAEAQLASAVLIALELGNSCVCSLGRVEADDASASGAAAGFVLNLCLLHVTNRAEQLDKILIAGRPRQLHNMSASAPGAERLGYSRCEQR